MQYEIGVETMKVLLINGSPHEQGCTNRALEEVASSLKANGVDSEIFWIGKGSISGCVACGTCGGVSNKCVFDDKVNEALEKMKEADALIVGSPVYYASLNGSLSAFLDRMFYAGACFHHKPAAAVASARRAGTTATLDIIQKYFTISQMPIVSSQYWNMVHGSSAEDVEKDLEGLQTMRTLGKNMAWMLKCIEAGKKAGIDIPDTEDKIKTNFIR